MELLKNKPPGAETADMLTEAYEARWGSVPAAARMTIANIARLQAQADALLAKAELAGPYETVRNGRQSFDRPRKGLEQAAKLMREVARLTDSLKIAPHNPRGADRSLDSDEADEADEDVARLLAEFDAL